MSARRNQGEKISETEEQKENPENMKAEMSTNVRSLTPFSHHYRRISKVITLCSSLKYGNILSYLWLTVCGNKMGEIGFS